MIGIINLNIFPMKYEACPAVSVPAALFQTFFFYRMQWRYLKHFEIKYIDFQFFMNMFGSLKII